MPYFAAAGAAAAAAVPAAVTDAAVSGAATAGASARATAGAVAGAVAAAEPVPGLTGASALVLIAVVVAVIAGLAVLPLLMDVRRATAWRQQLTDRLIDQAATDEEVRDFLRDLREPRGVRGLTRSIIAVLILSLVGFALAVAMLSSGADSGDLRKTIVTSLMTVLATVAGFYFGSLGALNSAEDARRYAARSRATATVETGLPAGAGGPAGAAQASAAEGPPVGGGGAEVLEGDVEVGGAEYGAGAESGPGGGSDSGVGPGSGAGPGEAPRKGA